MKEAEKNGEEIMQLTKSELEDLEADHLQIALTHGRLKKTDVEVPCRSNRRKLGAQAKRQEPNVATKLAIAKDVSEMMNASCDENEVRRRAMKRF